MVAQASFNNQEVVALKKMRMLKSQRVIQVTAGVANALLKLKMREQLRNHLQFIADVCVIHENNVYPKLNPK